MALNPSNSSNLEQLALKGLIMMTYWWLHTDKVLCQTVWSLLTPPPQSICDRLVCCNMLARRATHLSQVTHATWANTYLHQLITLMSQTVTSGNTVGGVADGNMHLVRNNHSQSTPTGHRLFCLGTYYYEPDRQGWYTGSVYINLHWAGFVPCFNH